MGTPLVVILVVYIDGISLLKFECDTPVSTDLHRPGSFPLPFEFMQIEAGQVHIVKGIGSCEESKDSPKPSCMLWIDG
jgi:hypothetical protein